MTAKELKALKDFTVSNDFGEAEYIDPSGKKVVTRSMSGSIEKGTREITEEGMYCHQYAVGVQAHCWVLWKRGKYYLSAHLHSGVVTGVGEPFTIKPGNTENL